MHIIRKITGLKVCTELQTELSPKIFSYITIDPSYLFLINYFYVTFNTYLAAPLYVTYCKLQITALCITLYYAI